MSAPPLFPMLKKSKFAATALGSMVFLLATPTVFAEVIATRQSAHLISQSVPSGTDALALPSEPTLSNSELPTPESYYRPPRNTRPYSGSRTTTGTRQGSCLGETDTGFAILGPEDPDTIVGHTAAGRPTFVWHLPESTETFPIIFRLLSTNDAGRQELLYKNETLPYTAGFSTFQLPTSVPALTAGKEYRWQIVVECNPNYPSRSLVQELSFEVVSAPADLSQKLSVAPTEVELAAAYGQAGLWYEAIAQVAEGTTPAAQQTRTGLLLDLAASLEADNAQLSETIRAIAEATAP